MVGTHISSLGALIDFITVPTLWETGHTAHHPNALPLSAKSSDCSFPQFVDFREQLVQCLEKSFELNPSYYFLICVSGTQRHSLRKEWDKGEAMFCIHHTVSQPV